MSLISRDNIINYPVTIQENNNGVFSVKNTSGQTLFNIDTNTPRVDILTDNFYINNVIYSNDGVYLQLTGGTMTGTINSESIIPTSSVTYDIGSLSKLFNHIFAQSLQINANVNTVPLQPPLQIYQNDGSTLVLQVNGLSGVGGSGLLLNGSLSINGEPFYMNSTVANSFYFNIKYNNNTLFNINTVVGSGQIATYNQVIDDGYGNMSVNGNLTVNGLNSNQLVLTNTSKQLISSLTLPSGCTSTNQTLITPTIEQINNSLILNQSGSGVTESLTISSGTIGSGSTTNISKLVYSTVGGGGGAVSSTIQLSYYTPITNYALQHIGASAYVYDNILLPFSSTVSIGNSSTPFQNMYSTGLYSNYLYLSTPTNGNAVVIQNSTFQNVFGVNTSTLAIDVTNVIPIIDNTYSCGTSSNRFTTIYAVNGTIQTSTSKLKKDISILDSKLLSNIVDELKPVSFKWKNDKSKKVYLGLIAEDLQQTLKKFNLKADGLLYTPDDNKSNDYMGINYSNLISILIGSIQNLNNEVISLKNDLSILKNQLNDILNK